MNMLRRCQILPFETCTFRGDKLGHVARTDSTRWFNMRPFSFGIEASRSWSLRHDESSNMRIPTSEASRLGWDLGDDMHGTITWRRSGTCYGF